MSKKVLLFETDDIFRKDLRRRVTLGDYGDDLEVIFQDNFDNIEEVIEEEGIDELVVNAKLLSDISTTDFDGIKIRAYAKSPSDLKKIMESGIESYGITKMANLLLDKISRDEIMEIKEDNDEPPQKPAKSSSAKARNIETYEEDDEEDMIEEGVEDEPEEDDEEDDIVSRTNGRGKQKPRAAKEKPVRKQTRKPRREEYEDDYDDEDEEPVAPARQGSRKKSADFVVSARRGKKNAPAYDEYDEPYDDDEELPEPDDDIYDDEEYEKPPRARKNNRKAGKKAEPVKTKRNKRRYDEYDNEYDDEYDEPDDEYDDGYDEPDDEYDEDDYDDGYDEDDYRKYDNRGKRNSGASRMKNIRDDKERRMATRADREARRQVNEDLSRRKQKTTVVTISSAKGGVGKTTISSELAVYLSRTNNGRKNFRVCIVDYNIDFGDVLTRLNFDADVARQRSCLTTWIDDIRDRVDSGENISDIRFTRKEIERYLIKDDESGLYALVAPISNDDSIGIKTAELQTVFDNLIKYGGFDFIICDTGNNTRDSTTICLEKADIVIMILTQDMNTINCNDSLINTLYKINFDLSKFRIIINQAKPERMVKLSVDDVKGCIINPENDKPIECIAVINDSDSVRAANNDQRPLVYEANNPFTSSIKSIASYVIGEDYDLEDEEKKPGVLSKFFGIFGKK